MISGEPPAVNMPEFSKTGDPASVNTVCVVYGLPTVPEPSTALILYTPLLMPLEIISMLVSGTKGSGGEPTGEPSGEFIPASNILNAYPSGS